MPLSLSSMGLSRLWKDSLPYGKAASAASLMQEATTSSSHNSLRLSRLRKDSLPSGEAASGASWI